MTLNYSEKFRNSWLSIITITVLVVVNIVLVQKTLLFNKYSYLINSFEDVRRGIYSESYRCLDFSGDLQKKLKEQGIDSQIDIVEQEGKTNEYHAVVSIQIEPQTGQAVSYKTVDSCTNENGELICEKGTIKEKNLYVADKVETK